MRSVATSDKCPRFYHHLLDHKPINTHQFDFRNISSHPKNLRNSFGADSENLMIELPMESRSRMSHFPRVRGSLLSHSSVVRCVQLRNVMAYECSGLACVRGRGAPIPIINLDEYEMVEFENGTNATMWEDHLILPDSPDSTLPGFGTIISPIVLPDADDDQIVPNEPVVSPVVPSFTYPSFPDSLLTTLWREYYAIKRGDTPRTDMEVPVILAPVQWELYCYTCGETGHYPGMCCFYRPYGNSAIRCALCDGIGHYASSCPRVIVGPSEGASRVLTPASTNASTLTVIEDYWSRPGCLCCMSRYRNC
ncbi:unnamed protein product [Arabidopsis halleri]